jgi:sugar (pentulose or hexulose) kinase
MVLDQAGNCLAEANVTLLAPTRDGHAVEQSPERWWKALEELLPALLGNVATESIGAIALDGTSGTVLLTNSHGTPLGPALMYNDNRATTEAEQIAAIAPRDCAAHGTGSGLAKAMWLLNAHGGASARLHTQADWIAGMLSGDFSTSDTNNVLKLGYDPIAQGWPDWLSTLGIDQQMLPRVLEPGTPIAPLRPELAERWNLPGNTLVCAGTTDSTAAFIASGATEAGEAVTSLGSTLVVKILSPKPIFAPEYGVYSQPLGRLWLVGGGSNSGGAVLRQFFDDKTMQQLTPRLDPENLTGLNYYPLCAPGERFPFNDPKLLPRLTPRPDEEVRFFQALLEGMARIEQQGYQRLAELGAPYPVSVRTNGGGAKNPAWTRIRERHLGVPMLKAEQEQACYGAAQLALKGLRSTTG